MDEISRARVDRAGRKRGFYVARSSGGLIMPRVDEDVAYSVRVCV